jgi:Tol biopolymer transport system component
MRRNRVLGVLGAVLVAALLYRFLAPRPALLVSGSFRVSHPQWSPDGRHVAMRVEGAGMGANIGVYDFLKKEFRILGQMMPSAGQLFSWSPDGQRLAFSAPDGGYERRVQVLMDPAGGTPRRIGAGSAGVFADENTLLMACEDDADPRPYTERTARFCKVNLTSGAVESLGGAASGGAELSALHELRLFSISSEMASKVDAAVEPLTVGGFRNLTTDGRSQAVHWSPDGREALVVSGDDILAIDPSSPDTPRTLVSGIAGIDASTVRLTPSGRHVLFAVNNGVDRRVAEAMTGGPPVDLWIAPVEATGEKPRRLRNQHSFKRDYAISPDGKRIVYEVVVEHTASRGVSKSELWMMGL